MSNSPRSPDRHNPPTPTGQWPRGQRGQLGQLGSQEPLGRIELSAGGVILDIDANLASLAQAAPASMINTPIQHWIEPRSVHAILALARGEHGASSPVLVWSSPNPQGVRAACAIVPAHDQRSPIGDKTLLIAINITEDWAPLQQRASLARWLESALHELPHAITISDLRTRRAVFVSRGYGEIFGVPPAFLLNDPYQWRSLIHPEDLPRVSQDLERAHFLTTGRYATTYRILRPDGASRLVTDIGIPIADDQHTIIGSLGVASDLQPIASAFAVDRVGTPPPDDVFLAQIMGISQVATTTAIAGLREYIRRGSAPDHSTNGPPITQP